MNNVSNCAEYILSECDLQPLLGFAGGAAAKWRRIGVALKFSKNVLDAIAATPRSVSPIDCFADLLSRWLRWGPPKHDLPSLQTLAEALREDTVGEEKIAYDLTQGLQRKI